MSVRSPSGASSCATVSTSFRNRQALAGQRRLGDLERCRLQQPAVRGHDVSGLDRDDVAGNELLCGDLDELPAPEDSRLDDHHLLERGDRRRRLALLVQAENGVEQRQEEQDQAGAELVQRPDAPDPGDEQDDLHRVAVLTHERAPARLALGGDERVRAVLLEPPRGFVGCETGMDVDAELSGDVLARQCEPLLALRRCAGLGVQAVAIVASLGDLGRVECHRRAGLASQQGPSVVDRADRGDAARAFGEHAGRAHLRAHRPFGELRLGELVR